MGINFNLNNCKLCMLLCDGCISELQNFHIYQKSMSVFKVSEWTLQYSKFIPTIYDGNFRGNLKDHTNT